MSSCHVSSLPDGDVLRDAGLLILRDALGDPHDVPDLLLLELHVRIEHPVLELHITIVNTSAMPLLLIVKCTPTTEPHSSMWMCTLTHFITVTKY